MVRNSNRKVSSTIIISKSSNFQPLSFGTPSFKSLRSSSYRASHALSGNKSSGTKNERVLHRALWKVGLRFQKNVRQLLGSPDIVFSKERVAVFCDGNFWHGKNWRSRKRKLQTGSNARYWVAKIESNIKRDKFYATQLRKMGWKVVRLWESEVLANPSRSARKIARIVFSRRTPSNSALDLASKSSKE